MTDNLVEVVNRPATHNVDFTTAVNRVPPASKKRSVSDIFADTYMPVPHNCSDIADIISPSHDCTLTDIKFVNGAAAACKKMLVSDIFAETVTQDPSKSDDIYDVIRHDISLVDSSTTAMTSVKNRALSDNVARYSSMADYNFSTENPSKKGSNLSEIRHVGKASSKSSANWTVNSPATQTLAGNMSDLTSEDVKHRATSENVAGYTSSTANPSNNGHKSDIRHLEKDSGKSSANWTVNSPAFQTLAGNMSDFTLDYVKHGATSENVAGYSSMEDYNPSNNGSNLSDLRHVRKASRKSLANWTVNSPASQTLAGYTSDFTLDDVKHRLTFDNMAGDSSMANYNSSTANPSNNGDHSDIRHYLHSAGDTSQTASTTQSSSIVAIGNSFFSSVNN